MKVPGRICEEWIDANILVWCWDSTSPRSYFISKVLNYTWNSIKKLILMSSKWQYSHTVTTKMFQWYRAVLLWQMQKLWPSDVQKSELPQNEYYNGFKLQWNFSGEIGLKISLENGNLPFLSGCLYMFQSVFNSINAMVSHGILFWFWLISLIIYSQSLTEKKLCKVTSSLMLHSTLCLLMVQHC